MRATLRGAKLDDASAVAEVITSSRRAFVSYAPMAHSPAEVLQWVRQTLIPSRGTTVASVSEKVVGVLAVSESDNIGWIDQLYVSLGFVGRGIGASLLEYGLASLRRPVRLYTFQANAGARRFYERHGFRAVQFTDGSSNEERCPDVLLELA